MTIWVCEMDYYAWDTPDCIDNPHPWKYYVLAETGAEAEAKVYADKMKRGKESAYPSAKVTRVYECPSGIV